MVAGSGREQLFFLVNVFLFLFCSCLLKGFFVLRFYRGDLFFQQFEDLQCFVEIYIWGEVIIVGLFFVGLIVIVFVGGFVGSSMVFLVMGRVSQVVWCSGLGFSWVLGFRIFFFVMVLFIVFGVFFLFQGYFRRGQWDFLDLFLFVFFDSVVYFGYGVLVFFIWFFVIFLCFQIYMFQYSGVIVIERFFY